MSAIESSVLVLNRLWQAVNLCSARRAFGLLYQGHAHVVHAEESDFYSLDFARWAEHSRHYDGADIVHTVSTRIRIPRVILLILFERLPSKEVKFTRHNVFERDNHTCQYCGHRFDNRSLNLDHVVPRERGGKTVWENIVCSCIWCNSRKGNRTPQEAGMKLLRKPRRPRWRPLVASESPSVPEVWRRFVDLDSWKVELS